MNRLIDFFNSLPSWAKGLAGFFAVFGTIAVYFVGSSLVDPNTEAAAYKFDNQIDQSILPSFDEKKKKPKPQKVLNFPKDDSFKPVKTVKKKKPAQKPKPKVKPKLAVQKFGPKPQPVVVRETIKPPFIITEDLRGQQVALFNQKSMGFSKVVNMTASSSGLKANLNTNKKWPVKTDENTYPTDLSRVVTKEKFISAILNNKIVSTLAGKVLLTIDHNIFGSHGNKILIPVGTKASGSYEPVEKIGIERLQITIERMVTPDGQLILFRKPAIMADPQGATGVMGDVDHKYLAKFGLPLAFSIANNSISLAFQKLIDSLSSKDDDSSLAQIFNEQWSKDQSQTNREIIAEIIKNNINIMPTITIPAGQKILLYLEHDIWFKQNKNGSIVAVNAQL
jgi:type IV secretory pathway VirB10-like protein